MKKQVRIDYRNVTLQAPFGNLQMPEVSLVADEGEGTVGPLRRWFKCERMDDVKISFEEAKVVH